MRLESLHRHQFIATGEAARNSLCLDCVKECPKFARHTSTKHQEPYIFVGQGFGLIEVQRRRRWNE